MVKNECWEGAATDDTHVRPWPLRRSFEEGIGTAVPLVDCHIMSADSRTVTAPIARMWRGTVCNLAVCPTTVPATPAVSPAACAPVRSAAPSVLAGEPRADHAQLCIKSDVGEMTAVQLQITSCRATPCSLRTVRCVSRPHRAGLRTGLSGGKGQECIRDCRGQCVQAVQRTVVALSSSTGLASLETRARQ
mmetsp:Transcript_16608/g.43108  ORF Transcript_16608/g.43108 Transcript_16608/m.43108 type:complete len:191 (-) Transcript_16608:248-820(-)